MQTLAANSAFTTKKNNLIQAPAKICMHLTNPAKSDFRVMRDARTLIAAGYKVTIIDAEQDRSLPAAEEIDGVCLKHVFVPGWFTPAPFKLWFLVKFSILFIYCVMHLLREDAELYHAHVEKALPACYAVARLRRKPLIFDAPDLTLSDPHLMRWRRLRKLAIGFLAHMVARCAAVVTASPYYVPVLRNLYRASNVIVLRNVPVYQAVDSSDRLRQHLGLGSDTRIVLYQGNIQANRRLDKVIRAAKFFNSGIVLVLMGFADDTSRSQLAELIASEGVAERVKMLPPAPYTELLSWTASADIGLTIFPPEYSLSIKFTLPNKLFEYMMAGLPVLSAPLAAISEIIKTYDIGRIAPSLTPDDLGAAINDMLADPVALARMHENALEAAHREFHWENEGQKLVQLYQTILTQQVF